MQKTPITISANDLLTGISESKYLGVQMIQNLDLFSDKGVIKLAYKTEQEATAPTSAYYELVARDEINNVTYYASSGGSIYKRTAGGTWTDVAVLGNSGATNCRGLAVFQDYLFSFYNSGSTVRADRFGPLSGVASWSNNFGTFANVSSAYNIPTIAGQDNILYLGIKYNVASLSDATNAATINTSALDLPTKYTILSLEELGTNLLVGTINGNVADIFPWDRVSPSFDLPAKTSFAGIAGMKNINNIVYAVAGGYGDILQTNGTQIQTIKRLSRFTEEPDIQFAITQNCIDLYDGGILFGIGKTAGSNNSTAGLYYLKEGIWQTFTTTAGNGTSSGVTIGTVTNIGNKQWLVSWSSGGTNRFDIINTSRRISSYGGYFISQTYQVGTRLEPRVFQSGKFQFAKALSSGQGIKIEYRLTSDASWTELDTFAYGDGSGSDRDNLGAITSFDFNPNIPKAENVQFKISLTTNTSNTATPELLYVTFE